MKQKILNIVSYMTLLLTMFFVGTIFFWLNYPYKPIDVKNDPVTLNDTVVESGGTLYYYIDYCKYTDRSATVVKTFIDGVSYSVPTVQVASSPGCAGLFVPVSVPYSLPAGEYVLRITLIYKVNPIRDVEITVYTEPFEVIQHE